MDKNRKKQLSKALKNEEKQAETAGDSQRKETMLDHISAEIAFSLRPFPSLSSTGQLNVWDNGV